MHAPSFVEQIPEYCVNAHHSIGNAKLTKGSQNVKCLKKQQMQRQLANAYEITIAGQNDKR